MKKRMIPVLIAIVLIIVMGGIGAVSILLGKYSYSDVMMNLEEYYDLTEADQVAIVHGNEHIETKAKLNQGTYYLDFASVQSLNYFFFFPLYYSGTLHSVRIVGELVGFIRDFE